MKQIETQFSQLRLTGMGHSWQALLETKKVTELSLIEGLEILLQAEKEERANRRFVRLQNNAKFRYRASIEEVDYNPARGINKSLITNLATCEYISKGEAVLITGATGCGKSFIASALGHQACAHGKSVAYFNTHKLMARIKMTRLDGSILKFFDKLVKQSEVDLGTIGDNELVLLTICALAMVLKESKPNIDKLKAMVDNGAIQPSEAVKIWRGIEQRYSLEFCAKIESCHNMAINNPSDEG